MINTSVVCTRTLVPVVFGWEIVIKCSVLAGLRVMRSHGYVVRTPESHRRLAQCSAHKISTLTLFICASEPLESSCTTVFVKSEIQYARITARWTLRLEGGVSFENFEEEGTQRLGESVLHFASEFRRIMGSFLAKLSPVRPQLLRECRFPPCKRGVVRVPRGQRPLGFAVKPIQAGQPSHAVG